MTINHVEENICPAVDWMLHNTTVPDAAAAGKNHMPAIRGATIQHSTINPTNPQFAKSAIKTIDNATVAAAAAWRITPACD